MNAIIQVEIPDAFRQVLADGQGEARLPRWTLEALVAEAVREGLISRGKGGEILGLGFQQREEFYAQRGLTYQFSEAELESDLKNLQASLLK